MRLLQARVEARATKVKKYEEITLELIGPEERRVKCTWLDPNKGSFTIEGENGYHMVDDFLSRNMQVQNIKIERR